MKLFSGKRIGQSGQEVLTAAAFSLIVHVIFAFAAVLLFSVTPRVFMPPLYTVKLVDPAADPAVVSKPKPEQQAAPKPQAKPEAKPKAKTAAPRPRPAEPKNSLPELTAKQKPEAPEETPVKPQAAEAPAEPAAPPGAGQESVSLRPQQDFKYGWYLARVRDKIGQNWKPPVDSKEARARVVFSVNRSGWVGVVNLVDDQTAGRFEFQQAAIRAIRASNPFPPLPEEFSRQTLEFTVDLMAIE